MNVAQPNPSPVNGKSLPEFDDEEYEVEYEDEEFGDEEAIEVDDETEGRPQIMALNDDDEQIEYEYEDEEVEVDDAEYDRIANKIDELLNKTNSLKQDSPPSVPVAPAAEYSSAPTQLESSPAIQNPTKSDQIEQAEQTKVENKTVIQKVEKADDVKEIEEAEKSEHEMQLPPQVAKRTSPPIERSSTVEDGSNLSPPGQLRHVHNQWNISDLNDEENFSVNKGNIRGPNKR